MRVCTSERLIWPAASMHVLVVCRFLFRRIHVRWGAIHECNVYMARKLSQFILSLPFWVDSIVVVVVVVSVGGGVVGGSVTIYPFLILLFFILLYVCRLDVGLVV